MTILDIVIKGEDDASDELKSVDGALGKLGKTAGTAAKIGMGIAAAGVAAVGVAAVATAKAALNLSTDIDNATNNIAAQLGMSKDEATGFEDVMKGIFANNFGDSFEDISAAIVTVSQGLGEMPDAALQGIAEDAFALRDAFELDVTQSVTGAKALMEAFGISGEQSMDFIASGMQNGLNASDDFVESIGEYSNLFSEAGFSADEMYNIMASGAQAGILGTDKIADAVKEMGIILNEGGDDTKEAFDKIGLSFDDISGFVASGDESWADYFDNIVGGLNEIDDPMERSKAQVAIFGTMAEDLGVSFTEGLSAAGLSLEDMSMATEALNVQYENWPSMWEGAKRGALLALEPLGDTLLEIGNEVLPIVQDAFEKITAWITENLPPAIERAKEIVAELREGWEENFGGIRDFVLGVWDSITKQFDAFKKLFSGDLEGFGKGILDSWTTIWNTVADFIGELWPLVKPHLVAAWKAIVDWFSEQDWVQIGEDILAFITDKLSEFWDWTKPHLVALWKSFSDWFGDQDWAQHGRDIVAAIVEALTTFADFIGPKLKAWFKSFTDWVGDQDWKGIATTLVTAIIAGLSWFVDTIGTELAKWYAAFTTWAQDNVTWENIGYWITTAILAAIAAMKDLDKKLMEVWRAIKKWFDDQPWDEHGDTVVEKIKEGLGELWDKIKQNFKDLLAKLKEWFEDPEKFMQFGRDIINGLVAGVEEKIAAVEEVIGKITDGINRALGKGLEEDSPSRMAARHGASIPAGLAKGILDNVKILFDAINDVAVDVNINLAKRMADAMITVAQALGPAYRAINSILDFILPDQQKFFEKMRDFTQLVNLMVQEFARKGWILTRENLDMAKSMAEAILEVAGAVADTIDAMKVLSDTNFSEIVRGYHLHEQIKILRNIIQTTLREFTETALEMKSGLGDAIKDMASAASAVAGMIVPMIEAMTFLSGVDFAEIVRGYHLHEQIKILRNIVLTTMREFASAAMEMMSEGVSAISAYADAARVVFSLVTEVLDVIGAISDYVKPLNLRSRLIDFNNDMLQVSSMLISTLGKLGTDMAELLAPAEAAASSINAVLTVITPAIEGLAAMAEFIPIEDIKDRVGNFGHDLVLMIDRLVRDLFFVGGRFTDEVYAIVVKAAEDINTIVSVIIPAVDALKALGEIEIVDTSVKVRALLAQVKIIVNELADVFSNGARRGGGLSPSVVANALLFSEAMAATLSSVASAMDSMRSLMAEDIPGGITEVLQRLQDILKAAIVPVFEIGFDIGRGLIIGIIQGMTQGAEALGEAINTILGAIGSPGISASVTGGGGAGAAMGAGGGLTTNLNMGGLTFNTTINDQMTQDEFEFRVIEVVRGLVP